MKRLDLLLALPERTSKNLFKSTMTLCNITYLAPADAGNLDMPEASFDLYVSNDVLEHIPPEDLHRILRGARRLLKPGGLCAHHIDNADHFFGCDPQISMINFLRFDDTEWNRYANNRFAYVNRLRSSEYPPIFSDSGFEILDVQNEIDDECVKQIETGALPLAERFRNMAVQDLATTSTTIVAAPSRGEPE